MPRAMEKIFTGTGSARSTMQEAADRRLPGTVPLTMDGDLAAQMVAGIRQYLQRQTGRLVAERAKLWDWETVSPDQHEHAIAAHRESLRRIIGVVDVRVAAGAPELIGTVSAPAQIAAGPGYKVFLVRWPVLPRASADGRELEAEGLLLQPEGTPMARVVALPDADWTPEMAIGLAPGVPAPAQFARRLAESGCEVIVPLLLNREDTFSGIPGVAMTNMPHREWIYRMAYEVGRHIIGYEVQKVLAAVDWFELENLDHKVPIGVMGYGEGGLLALYCAAIDTRIDATVVSGYFQPREELWQEPIYRDIWSFSREFGDAELAALIAPRALMIEASHGPEIGGPPLATEERKPYACPNGTLTTPSLEEVKREVTRARSFFRAQGAESKLQLFVSGEGKGLPGSAAVLQAYLQALDAEKRATPSAALQSAIHWSYDPLPRLRRQFNQMVDFTQALARSSAERRRQFWSKADPSSLERWKQTTRFYRKYIWDEVIGRMPSPSLPPNPQSRLVLDEPSFRGYEVVLDVWPGIFAYGILLLPEDMKAHERRAVVVCQHGLEGRPQDVADPRIDDHFYHHFAVSLAEQGFITFAPQNPYIGKDEFRIIQRMGHPQKLALYSFILGQHEQILNWLIAQPFVDPERIGFYGLSYGGKTAMRVPPLLDRYALSICSGDFNEWVWKTTTVADPHSYLLTAEYDMYEFNFANIVNYADLANLMAPRPFMVERGHEDIVGTDTWVAYEYAKVREFYDKMGIGDKTEIGFFNGPHTIHGVETFRFLRKHFGWHAS
ncbi:MAG: dienelactone hydrolase family protein [Candidatus Sulfotelmatobacter sp.]